MPPTDPFAASGGGVQVAGGGWVPANHPAAAGATASGTASGSATTTPFVPTDAPAFTAPQWQTPGQPMPEWQALGQPSPTFQAPAAFQAPTAQTMQVDPGYQFRLQQGQQALDASAAARGTLRGGAQMKALTDYGQQAGSQEYANAYNRARDVYGLNYQAAKDTYGAARDAYGDSRYERDAQFGAVESNYGRDFDERQRTFDSGMAARNAEYQPGLLSWQAKNLAGQRGWEIMADRDWQEKTYWNDDSYRKGRDAQDYAYRWGTYRGDDAWRRERAGVTDKQWLAELGNY